MLCRLHGACETAVVLKNKPDAKPEEKMTAENAFKESQAQAAQIFAELYRSQLPDGIPEKVENAINKI